MVIEGPPIQKTSSAMGWTNTVQLETNASLAKIILPASSLGTFPSLPLLFSISPFLMDFLQPFFLSLFSSFV